MYVLFANLHKTLSDLYLGMTIQSQGGLMQGLVYLSCWVRVLHCAIVMSCDARNATATAEACSLL